MNESDETWANFASTIADPILAQDRKAAMYEAGAWPDKTMTEYLDAATDRHPDKVAVTGKNSMTGITTTLSWNQLRVRVDRIALGLRSLEVGRGDVVSIQLPNWWEFIAIKLACSRIGAVCNPVMPIFRHREIAFMFDLADSKVAVVPRDFRGFNHAQMMSDIKGDLPRLSHCFVIGGDGESSFEDYFVNRRWEDNVDTDTVFSQTEIGPNEIMQLLYTSGTTGEPKGAMHTSNTLLSNLLHYSKRLSLTGDDVIFMPSPVAHQAGYMYGVMLPVFLGAKLVLQDIWDPVVGLELIQDECATFTMAATPFLADLTDSPELESFDVSKLRNFVCGGAPVPSALVERARKNMSNTNIIAAWGMTEVGAATLTRIGDPNEKIAGTDGVPIDNVHVRIIDPQTRKEVARGVEGLLQCSGPGNFVGYLKRPELYGTDAEGWFDTGDLAYMDDDGYIRITGRDKDIIIRGGENVPVIEIENCLFRLPEIKDVAVVGMPDDRLGERGCLFAVLNEGHSFDLAQMQAALASVKMAEHYWPEHVEIIEEMPRTPSGKIQKFKLREMADNLRQNRTSATA